MRTIVHLSSSESDRHSAVVGNVQNLLDDDRFDHEAIALVTNGGGVPILTTDSPQRSDIEALAAEGVSLKACRNTLEGGDLTESDLIDGVEIVPSGIGEVARLQYEEGYAYFVP